MTSTKTRPAPSSLSVVEKSPTGIGGLDEITFGGLPKGRPTLLCGSAGCGKTLFAMTFLYNGAVEYDEPGVFIAFEERPQELIKNVGSLRYDVQKLIDKKKLAIDYVHIDPGQIDEAGDYDLEGLFLRLGFAIDLVGAKRVVIDTIEVPLWRPEKPIDTAFRAATVIRLVERKRCDCRRYRRTGRGHADTLWT